MEEAKKTFHKQEKSKTVISIGKAGGGGIGVSIIFLSGAVASATAALLIRRRLRKSSNSKSGNHDRSTASAKFMEDKNMNQDKGFHFVSSDSSPDVDTDHNLSNGTTKTGAHDNNTTVISDQSFFFLDEKDKLKVNGEKGDPVTDGEGIIHSNFPKRSDSSLEFVASAITVEESPVPIDQKQTLLQPVNAEDSQSRERIELIKEDDATETAFVDQGKEEENQHTLVMILGDEMEINGGDDEHMNELNCQDAAETTEADQRMPTILQSREQEISIHSGHESYSSGGSLPKTNVFVGQCSFLPAPGNSSLYKKEKLGSKKGSQAFETVEIVRKDEALKAADASQKKDAKIQMTEVDDSLTKGNGELEASQECQGNGNTSVLMFVEEENKCDKHDCLLIIGANEVGKRNKELEATDENQSKGNTVILTSEDGEKKCHVGRLTIETVQVLEEVKALLEAEGKDKSQLLLFKQETGSQYDEEMTGEERQATSETAQLLDDIVSGSNQQKLQIEEPETPPNAEDNSFSDELTSKDNSFENCGANVLNVSLTVSTISAPLNRETGSGNGLTEVQLPVAVSNENVARGPATEDNVGESENPLMQLAEKQQHLNEGSGKTLEEVGDTSHMQHADSVIIAEQNLLRPKEDSISDERDGDEDEANMDEKVEEVSEGTVDSSIESNAEPIWPAESLQELPMELNEQKQKLQMEEDQTVKTKLHMHLKNIDNDGINKTSLKKGNDEKGNLKMTFLDRFVRELKEQIHQPTNSERRILILTLLVISSSLCFWHFGLPFLKICLIVILIKILSKIHGI